jgi:hypothetical protein
MEVLELERHQTLVVAAVVVVQTEKMLALQQEVMVAQEEPQPSLEFLLPTLVAVVVEDIALFLPV